MAKQALWEMEKRQVVELIVRWNEINANRKMTKMDDVTTFVIHLFSFREGLFRLQNYRWE